MENPVIDIGLNLDPFKSQRIDEKFLPEKLKYSDLNTMREN
jgi:hypothetical protein